MSIELTQEQFEKIRKEIIILERKRIVKDLVTGNCFACQHYNKDNPHYCNVGNECGTKEAINIVNNGMK